jgi:hypothetical protein
MNVHNYAPTVRKITLLESVARQNLHAELSDAVLERDKREMLLIQMRLFEQFSASLNSPKFAESMEKSIDLVSNADSFPLHLKGLTSKTRDSFIFRQFENVSGHVCHAVIRLNQKNHFVVTVIERDTKLSSHKQYNEFEIDDIGALSLAFTQRFRRADDLIDFLGNQSLSSRPLDLQLHEQVFPNCQVKEFQWGSEFLVATRQDGGLSPDEIHGKLSYKGHLAVRNMRFKDFVSEQIPVHLAQLSQKSSRDIAGEVANHQRNKAFRAIIERGASFESAMDQVFGSVEETSLLDSKSILYLEAHKIDEGDAQEGVDEVAYYLSQRNSGMDPITIKSYSDDLAPHFRLATRQATKMILFHNSLNPSAGKKEAFLRHKLSCSPRFQDHYILGMHCLNDNQFQETVRLLSYFVKFHPENIESHEAIWDASVALGQRGLGLAAIDRAPMSVKGHPSIVTRMQMSNQSN